MIKSPRLHDSARRMMKERGEDKQIISGWAVWVMGGVCKNTCMCDLYHPHSINRHVMPPSVQRSSLRVNHLTWC